MVSEKFDVVVVGGGNAGLVAALSAHETGARVAILEAAPREERGGNSRFSGSIFRITHEGLDDVVSLLSDSAKVGAKSCTLRPYTKEEYLEDMNQTSRGKYDRGQASVVIDQSFQTVKWMKQQGVQWQLTTNKFFDRSKTGEGLVDIPPGAAVMSEEQGVGLVKALWNAVEKTTIKVFYDCPAFGLVAEGDRVTGVKARLSASYTEFRGQVVLASGGFEANPRLRRQYLGEGWDLVIVRGTRFNMGTMLEKAIAAGAQSCGHWGSAHASPQDLKAPPVGDLKFTDQMSRYSYPYAVMVNQDGVRFLDEGENLFGLTYAKTGAAIGRQPGAKGFQIFDQKTLHLLEPRYRTATPITDDTLGGLAKKIGVNPSTFTQTVAEFNAATSPGKFDPFHLDAVSTGSKLAIPKSNWALPIDKPPYVAYGVTCGITFTYGGLKTNTSARVLNDEGRPMRGLWAVGEMSGGYFYFNYPAGAGLIKGAVFGRIAGLAAAKLAQSESSAPKAVSGEAVIRASL